MPREMIYSPQTDKTIAKEWKAFEPYASEDMEIVAKTDKMHILLTESFDVAGVPCLLLERTGDDAEELAYVTCETEKKLVETFRDLIAKMK